MSGAMEALSDGLRVELAGSGIAVSLIEPGPITTAFQANATARVDDEYMQSRIYRVPAAGGEPFVTLMTMAATTPMPS